MKYYVIVDGDGFVLSTELASIDPVATQSIAQEKMVQDPEYQRIADSIIKLEKIIGMTKPSTPAYSRVENSLNVNVSTVKHMLLQYIEANPVYTTPAPQNGTAIEVDVSVFERCNDELEYSNGRLIKFSDGEFSIVENNVGKKYFYQNDDDEWCSYVCESLSDQIPEEWICVSDLTADQKTEIKLQNETNEEKSSRIYNEKFTEFLTDLFLDSKYYREFLEETDGGE